MPIWRVTVTGNAMIAEVRRVYAWQDSDGTWSASVVECGQAVLGFEGCEYREEAIFYCKEIVGEDCPVSDGRPEFAS